MGLQFSVLGPVEAHEDGRSIDLGSPRQRLITYELTNVGDKATDGVLINVSLPPDVVLNFDPAHCQRGIPVPPSNVQEAAPALSGR